MDVTTLPPPESRAAEQDGATRGAPPAAKLVREDRDVLVLEVSGAWKLGAPRPALGELAAELEHPPRTLRITAPGLESWDSSLLAWLWSVSELCARAEVDVDRSGLPPGAAELLALARGSRPPEAAAPDAATEPRTRFLARVGRRATRFGHEFLSSLSFLGQVALALGRFVTLRARYRRADLGRWLQATGAEAVPIITLVSVIVGLILAFVGAVQLRALGADIFVANMVGIAMVREMGAMVVGIVMAGRTGAAFAAQLGTMKVNQEIDALRTFGIPPLEFLVLPRIVAIVAMAPLLCVFSIVIGILGGAFVGVGMLGLSPQLYFDQTLESFTLSDLYGGVFRGTVYALLIGIASCLRGMRCGNDAAAVGEATTSAVVASVVAIVIADGVMALCFDALGI